MFLVKISSGELSGWGEAGQYGPPEPVASAIKALDQKQNYCLNETQFEICWVVSIDLFWPPIDLIRLTFLKFCEIFATKSKNAVLYC